MQRLSSCYQDVCSRAANTARGHLEVEAGSLEAFVIFSRLLGCSIKAQTYGTHQSCSRSGMLAFA